MDIEVFCLNCQEATIRILEESFATHLDPAIGLSVQNLQAAKQVEIGTIGTRYTKLLEASVPPERGLQIEFVDREAFGSRLYLRVYWPLVPYQEAFFPSLEEVFSFFPAVAVRGRMVLVPLGLGEQLAGPPHLELPAVDPALGREVIETDFENENELRTAVASASDSIRKELREDVRAYAGFQKLSKESVSEAALALSVKSEFLERFLNSEAKSSSLYQQLTCDLDKTEFPHGRWTRGTLNVRNDTAEEIHGLSVEITGPVEILPKSIELDASAKSTASTSVSIKPLDQGEFPLEITLALPRDSILAQWLPSHHVWLKST